MTTNKFQLNNIMLHVEFSTLEYHRAFAVKQEDDGILFMFEDCLYDPHPMVLGGARSSGYDDTFLRNVLNTKILDLFPKRIRDFMIPVYKDDLLRIPTAKELFGENKYSTTEPNEITQFEMMRDINNRIVKRKYFSNSSYWLMNNHDDIRYCTCTNGAENYCDSYRLEGVRPVFKIMNI